MGATNIFLPTYQWKNNSSATTKSSASSAESSTKRKTPNSLWHRAPRRSTSESVWEVISRGRRPRGGDGGRRALMLAIHLRIAGKRRSRMSAPPASTRARAAGISSRRPVSRTRCQTGTCTCRRTTIGATRSCDRGAVRPISPVPWPTASARRWAVDGAAQPAIPDPLFMFIIHFAH